MKSYYFPHFKFLSKYVCLYNIREFAIAQKFLQDNIKINRVYHINSKYIVIVHCKGMTLGRHNVVKLSSFVMVAYQILWTLLGWFRAGGILIANNDFVSSSISMCNAYDWNHLDNNTSERRFVCGFPDDADRNENWSFVFVGSELFCVIQFIATFVVNLNVLEAFLYFKIFKSMHRYVNYASIFIRIVILFILNLFQITILSITTFLDKFILPTIRL